MTMIQYVKYIVCFKKEKVRRRRAGNGNVPREEVHSQLEKLLNLDLLSSSNRRAFQPEGTEGIKERERYNLKLVMG